MSSKNMEYGLMVKSTTFLSQVIFNKRDRKLRGKVYCKMTKFGIK